MTSLQRRARLEDALRGGAGRSAGARGRAASTAVLPFSRSARSPAWRRRRRSRYSRSRNAVRPRSRPRPRGAGQLVASALSLVDSDPSSASRSRAKRRESSRQHARRRRFASPSTRRGSAQSSTRVIPSSGWTSTPRDPASSSSGTTGSRQSDLGAGPQVVASGGRRSCGVHEWRAIGFADRGLGACDPRFSDGQATSGAGSHRARGPCGGARAEPGRRVGDRRRPRQAARTCRRAVHRKPDRACQASACRHRRRLCTERSARGERRARPHGADLGHANVARGHGAAGRPQWPGSRGRVRSHRRPSRDVEHRPGGARLASPHRSRALRPLRAHRSSERRCVPAPAASSRQPRATAPRGPGEQRGHPCACCSGTAGLSESRVRRRRNGGDGRCGRHDRHLGPRHEHCARSRPQRERAAPTTARAATADGTASATAEGNVIRLRTPSGEAARRAQGPRQQRCLQPRRPSPRQRRARPRRHRLGRRHRKEAFRIDEAQSASVEDARFSPDGRWLVTAGPISARLWTADGEGGRYL